MIIIVLLLVIIIIGLMFYNMSIHKKIESFKNINQQITSLNVLQDFMDTISETSSVDDKLKKINDILAELGSVAEGVKTSKAICELAKKLDIEVPVSNAIYEAVYTDITPQALLEKLMNRKLKEEERYV